MSYNSATKRITAPVSIKDVQQCLGVSDTDLGTLCQKSNVNMWSKCKPVEPSNGQPVIEALKLPNQGVTDNKTFKTINGTWGLKVVDENGYIITSPLTLDEIYTRWGWSGDSYGYVAALINNTRWTHDYPYSVFRLTDFANYAHTAAPFIQDTYTNGTITRYSSDDVYAETLYFWLTDNNFSLDIASMSSFVIGGTTLGQMYLCAVYEGDSQGEVFSDQPLAYYHGGDSIDMLIEDFTSGSTYDVYICLATKRDFWNDCRLFPLPNVQNLHTHIVVDIQYKAIFANLTLVGIGATNVDSGLNIDLRNVSYQSPAYYDAYGSSNILFAPSGKGVILKITGEVGSRSIAISPYQFRLALNSGISVSAAVQIVGANSICPTSPSTSQTTFSLAANNTYTFYVIATSVVADAVNEIQLSMTVNGHVSEGMQAASPWMNVHSY